MGGAEVLQISRICSVFLMITYGFFLFFMLKTHADLFSDDAEEEGPSGDELSPLWSVVLLLACTLVVFFCSECLVDSIEGVSEDYGISKAFIGVILLPIVGNAAEHATAVGSAYKGMMDLDFSAFDTTCQMLTVFLVSQVLSHGETTWLH